MSIRIRMNAAKNILKVVVSTPAVRIAALAIGRQAESHQAQKCIVEGFAWGLIHGDYEKVPVRLNGRFAMAMESRYEIIEEAMASLR